MIFFVGFCLFAILRFSGLFSYDIPPSLDLSCYCNGFIRSNNLEELIPIWCSL